MNNLTLQIGANKYSGWLSVSIRHDMQSMAGAFDLELSSPLEGDIPILRAGDACKLLVDNAPIITGYIDDVGVGYDAKTRRLSIAGRSKTADLIDCSLPVKAIKAVQFNGQTFAQLCRALAAPFDIKVVDMIGEWQPVKRAVIEQGQTVFDFLEQLARSQAVLLQTDAQGDLVITRTGTERIATAIALGENVLSASGQFTTRDRFSHYHFTAQAWGDDLQNGAESAHLKGASEDKNLRYRPTVYHADGVTNLGQLQARANWQRNVSYGRSKSVTYTVNGWQHADGLWQANTLVKVLDEWMAINEWLLITAVKHILNEGGQKTELTVMPPEAFDVIEIPVKPGAWN